jgi:hypothetical protein
MKATIWTSWLAPFVLALAVVMPVERAAAEPAIVVETGPRHHHWRERHEEPVVVRERHYEHERHARRYRHEHRDVVVVGR